MLITVIVICASIAALIIGAHIFSSRQSRPRWSSARTSEGEGSYGYRVSKKEAKLKAIAGLDLSPVARKCAERNRWTKERATMAEAEYRRFLTLLAEHPGQTISPWSMDLDLFWHEHILDTERYARDCQHIFGRMIHHDPHIASDPARHKKAKQTTDKLRGTSHDSAATSSAGCSTMVAIVSCSSSHAHDHHHGASCGSSHDSGGHASCGGSDGGGGHSCGGSSCGGGGGCGGGGCGGS